MSEFRTLTKTASIYNKQATPLGAKNTRTWNQYKQLVYSNDISLSNLFVAGAQSKTIAIELSSINSPANVDSAENRLTMRFTTRPKTIAGTRNFIKYCFRL